MVLPAGSTERTLPTRHPPSGLRSEPGSAPFDGERVPITCVVASHAHGDWARRDPHLRVRLPRWGGVQGARYGVPGNTGRNASP